MPASAHSAGSHRTSEGTLELAGVLTEGVAAVGIAALEAGHEPVHPLLAGAVREGIGHYVALALALEGIVPDGCSSVDSLADILLSEVGKAGHMVTPHPREAVGLKF